jgi:hypothetical protein
MKNAKLLLAVFAAAAMFTACGDDDNGSTTSASIVGKWSYTKTGASSGSQEVLFDYDNDTECASKDYVEFVEGGAYKDVDYYGTDCSFDTDTYTWTKDGNAVTINDGVTAYVLTVETLSATELKVKETYTMEGQTFNDVTVYTRQ